jgi:hypothetical protein
VGTGISQEIALTLALKIKTRCSDSMTSQREVMQGISRTEREADNQ